ncbi:dihydroneopterin aldolase [[Clostridium] ultunense Esp]|nr:dihydroneopterin aldolase [[Clostridium] ultunense Esp]
MDKLFIRGMQFYGYHGVFPEENKLGQLFIVDVECTLSLREAGLTDRLENTVDYAELYKDVKEVMEGKPYKLLETLAERICDRIFGRNERIDEVRLEIRKPNPPIPGHYREVGIVMERRRHG